MFSKYRQWCEKNEICKRSGIAKQINVCQGKCFKCLKRDSEIKENSSYVLSLLELFLTTFTIYAHISYDTRTYLWKCVIMQM